MWRRIFSIVLSAVLILAVGSPVFAHNGRIIIPNTIDPETDEHPWGGDHYNPGTPDSPIYNASGPGDFDGNYLDLFWNVTTMYFIPYLVHPVVNQTTTPDAGHLQTDEISTGINGTNPNTFDSGARNQ